MNILATVAIGVLLLLAGYAYVAYPVLLMLMRHRHAASPPDRTARQPWPVVTIVLPVYNERATIEEALQHITALDYPPDRLQILVVSDGATDGTDTIASRFASRGVELVRVDRRSGKTTAENAAISHVRGEIVVCTDASATIDPHAIKELVASFDDPRVGVASGSDVSVPGKGADNNPGEHGYVAYEMWVRSLESRAGGIIGASGCLYAQRRDLFAPLAPATQTRDFAAPLLARERGLVAVNVGTAKCYVPRAPRLVDEYRRKVRTMATGLATLYYLRRLLNPRRYGLFAWMLFSHKLARWLVPPAVVVALAGLLSTVGTSRLARDLLVAIGVIGGVLLLIAWLWPAQRRMPNVLAAAIFPVLTVTASLQAWFRAGLGRVRPEWEPTRRRESRGT